jgi:hypothetical protein
VAHIKNKNVENLKIKTTRNLKSWHLLAAYYTTIVLIGIIYRLIII